MFHVNLTIVQAIFNVNLCVIFSNIFSSIFGNISNNFISIGIFGNISNNFISIGIFSVIFSNNFSIIFSVLFLVLFHVSGNNGTGGKINGSACSALSARRTRSTGWSS
jgi:hypothetical protein